LAPRQKPPSRADMAKRVSDGSICCSLCSYTGQPSTFFIVEKQEEDDPEVGDDDAPFIPYKTYLCPDCFKLQSNGQLSGARITVPFKPREPDKLVPLPDKGICPKCHGPKSTAVCARCDNPTPLHTKVKGPKPSAPKPVSTPPRKGGLFA